MAGITVDSAFPLLELTSIALDGAPSAVITCAEVDELPLLPPSDGTPEFHQHEMGRELVVPGVVAVLVHGDGIRIHVRLHRDRPDRTDALISHLLVDQAIPRLLVARGETALHATCIAEDGAAVAFLGVTGTGKSTMAMGFCGEGAELVADDCLVVRPGPGGPIALASYPRGRLRDDSAAALYAGVEGAAAAAGKTAFATRGAGGDRPLVAVFVLDRAVGRDGTTGERLASAAALWGLAGHSFAAAAAPASEPEAQLVAATGALATMRWLAECVPVFRLRYPSDLGSLADVRAHVRTIIRNTVNPQR